MVNHDGVEHAGYLSFITMLAVFPFLVFFVALLGVFGQTSAGGQFIHMIIDRAPKYMIDPVMPSINEILSGPPHGLLTLSLIPMFMREIIGLRGLRNTLNYGANRIRYLSPVPAGTRLRARVSIVQAEDVPPDALRVTYNVMIEIEGGTRPACVAEVIGQHYR